MLTGINDVPWSKLASLDGHTARIPIHLPDLGSPDPAVFERGINRVYLQVIHQCTIYEATPYVIPFFIQLLDIQPVPAHKAYLMGCIAVLCYYGAEQLNPPWERPHELWRPGDLCYAAGIEGVATYAPYLGYPDGKVRREASRLLALFPERSDEFFAAQIESAMAETDAELQADLIENLASLCLRRQRCGMRGQRPYQELFAPLLDHPSAVVRWSAACATARLCDGRPCSPLILERLLEPIAALNADPESDTWLPRSWQARAAINFLAEEQRIPALLAYVGGLRDECWLGHIISEVINQVVARTSCSTTVSSSSWDGEHHIDEHYKFRSDDYRADFASAASNPTPVQRQVVREVRAVIKRRGLRTNLLEFCGLESIA